MLRTTAARSIAAFTIAATAALGLAACTGSPSPAGSGAASQGSADGPGDAGQSTADACALVQDTISEATDEFESASAEDPSSVVASMNAAADKLGATASQITNDEVAALLPELQEMFATTADVMQSIVDGDTSKLGDLSELGTDFQATGEKFQAICTP